MSAANVAVSKKAEHPTYREMISAAIVNLKERNGSSRQAIKKYIHANFKVCKNHLIYYLISIIIKGES